MPDINLLKNTEKYDPAAPKPTPPVGPGPLSDPSLEPKGIGGAFRSFFSRRPKPFDVATPVLGKATSGGGRMSLGSIGKGERILNEKKSRPSMIQLPEDEENFNVNLLGQDLGQVITLRRQLMKLGLVAIGSVLLIAAVYGGLVFYDGRITTDIKDTTAKIDALRGEISKLETTQRDIVATTKKITAISSLIDRHVLWTKFFAELEKSTSPDVFYGTNFSGDLNGSIRLAATAPTFETVATQYLFFQQALKRGGFIRSFTITGATAQASDTGKKVSFSVGLEVVPEVFYQTAEQARDATEPTAPAEPTPSIIPTP